MNEDQFERSADMRLVDLNRAAIGAPAPRLGWERSGSVLPDEAPPSEGVPTEVGGPLLSAGFDAQPRSGLIPGAVVTVSLALVNDGTAGVSGVWAVLPLPAGVHFAAGSLRIDATEREDALAEAFLSAGIALAPLGPGERRTLILRFAVENGLDDIILLPHLRADGAVGISGPRGIRLARGARRSLEAVPQPERPFYELDDEESALEAADAPPEPVAVRPAVVQPAEHFEPILPPPPEPPEPSALPVLAAQIAAEPETEPEPTAQPAPESATKPKPKRKPKTKPKLEAKPEPESEPEPEPKLEAKPEPEPEPAPASAPEPEPEPEMKARPEPTPKPDRQAVAKPAPKRKRVTEAKPQPQSEPEPEPAPAAELTPAPKPKPKPEPKSKPKPKSKSKSKPKPEIARAADAIPEPVALPEPPAEPAPEPAPEPRGPWLAAGGSFVLEVTLDRTRLTSLRALFTGKPLGMIAHYLVLNALATRRPLDGTGDNAAVAAFLDQQERLLSRALITTRLGKSVVPESVAAELPPFPPELPDRDGQVESTIAPGGAITLVRAFRPSEVEFITRALTNESAHPFLRAAQFFVGLAPRDAALDDPAARESVAAALVAYATQAAASISRIFLRAKLSRSVALFRDSDPELDAAGSAALAALDAALG
jgi:hypothetical protein